MVDAHATEGMAALANVPSCCGTFSLTVWGFSQKCVLLGYLKVAEQDT
jgi:hypothetical protein